jgi:D-lactate dehydrogenase
VPLAQGCSAVCVFVNDRLDAPVLEALHALGVRAVLLRCAGFNNVDLQAADALGCSSPACRPMRRKPWPNTRWHW